MPSTEITKTVAHKVLETVDAGLTSGLGQPIPGQMCVEAAVCFAMGLPHNDNPPCVSPALRSLKIRLNDASWSSNEVRAKGLRRLAVAQLGSAGALDEVEFAYRVARLAIQKSVPAALRAAAGLLRGDKKEKLLIAADLCEREPTQTNSRAAAYAAVDAANAAYAAANAAYAAVDAAAYAAANAAVDAAKAAVDAAAAAAAAAAANAAYAAVDAAAAAAADAAVDAAADAAAYAAAYAASARDRQLADFAEGVVQILVDMSAPGVQWLPLTETV